MSINNFEILDYLENDKNISKIKVKKKTDGLIYLLKRIDFKSLNKVDKLSSINEIRILSKLKHPNIIELKESFFDKISNTLNIITDFPDNGNLSNKINYTLKNEMYLEECIIWDVLTQILLGLNYLHKKGIILKNLRSDNIYLTKMRLVKITDFSSCIIVKKNNTIKNKENTSFYPAPELIIKSKYNNKCDIWSLGCIIYEMANLSLPYNGKNNTDLFNNIMKKKYKPIPHFYSKNLKSIINDMLIIDNSKRPSIDLLLNFPNVKETIKKLSLTYEKNKKIVNFDNINNFDKINSVIYNKNINFTLFNNLNEKKLNYRKININKNNLSEISYINSFQNNLPIKNNSLNNFNSINATVNINLKDIKLINNITYRTVKQRKIIENKNQKKNDCNPGVNSKINKIPKNNLNFNNIIFSKNKNEINRIKNNMTINSNNNFKFQNYISMSMNNEDIRYILNKNQIYNKNSLTEINNINITKNI